MSDAQRPHRQCTAKAKGTGERCRRPPIRGGTVCEKHGGSAPQVKRSARRRLLEMAEPAAAALSIALDTAVRQRDVPRIVAVAKAILDRAGHPAGAELHVQAEVGMKVDDRWPDALTTDERLVAQWLFARAMARRGHTEAQDALDTDGPSAYIKALVALVRAEATSRPALPPGPADDQEAVDPEVVDDEVLDAEVVDHDEEAA